MHYCFYIAIVCQTLPSPGNGYIEYISSSSDPYPYLSVASYHCDIGFGRSGGDRFRTCVGGASNVPIWNGTAPTCEGWGVIMHTITRMICLVFVNTLCLLVCDVMIYVRIQLSTIMSIYIHISTF